MGKHKKLKDSNPFTFMICRLSFLQMWISKRQKKMDTLFIIPFEWPIKFIIWKQFNINLRKKIYFDKICILVILTSFEPFGYCYFILWNKMINRTWKWNLMWQKTAFYTFTYLIEEKIFYQLKVHILEFGIHELFVKILFVILLDNGYFNK